MVKDIFLSPLSLFIKMFTGQNAVYVDACSAAKIAAISCKSGTSNFVFEMSFGTISCRFIAKRNAGRAFGLPNTPSVQTAHCSHRGPP